MINRKKDFFAILFLLILSVVFFYRLFIPKLSLFITPEIGVSDIWQLNYPYKVFLSQSLRTGKFPLWNKYIAGGFPVFAEGQTGTFNIYNLLAFTVLDPLIAFNLGFIVIFFISLSGMYFFAREKKLSTLGSIFTAFTFAFSGFFITHISHFNMIQTAAFLPWLFFIVEKLRKKTTVVLLLIFSILLSQQILSGYPQITFISVIAIFLYVTLLIILKQKSIKWGILLATSTLFAFILSAVQILPTLELTKISTRAQGLPVTELLRYAFPPIHFISFLDPFYFGNPMKGTYPHFNDFDGSIFWESTGYVGIIPIILLLAVFISKRKKFASFLLLLGGVSSMMMIGRFGPLSFLLTTPPFSLFRFPSRYILLLIFTISLLAGLGFDALKNLTHRLLQSTIRLKNIIVHSTIFAGLIILQIANIYSIWINYHPTATKQEFHQPPPILQAINYKGAVFTYKQSSVWFRNFFAPSSFTKEQYLHFRNELAPNANILFNVTSFRENQAMTPLRLALYNSLITQNLNLDSIQTISTNELKILGARNVSSIISPIELNHDNLELENIIASESAMTTNYWVYKNTNRLPRIYMVPTIVEKTTLPTLMSYLKSDEFDPKNQVILEKNTADYKLEEVDKNTANNYYSVSIIKDLHDKLSFNITTGISGFLVVADTYYPGWKAYVDGKETEIQPANLVSRALKINKGTHKVEFVYKSNTFKTGLVITIIGYGITVVLVSVKTGSEFLRIALGKL